MLPYVETHPIKETETRPADWKALWEGDGTEAFVLESGKAGRYTFFGRNPVSVMEGKGESAVVNGPSDPRYKVTGRPLELIKQWMEPYRSPALPGLPKFIGGCVGMIGYDVARSLEKLPVLAADDLGLPDYVMLRFEELWIIDQEEHRLYCAVHMPVEIGGPDGEQKLLEELYGEAAERAAQMKAFWDEQMSGPAAEAGEERAVRRREFLRTEGHTRNAWNGESPESVERAFGREEFMEAVRRIQRYISDGDVFQVNLSVRQSKALEAPAEEIYEWLRLLNPSPYMGMLRLRGFDLVSGSPELLVQLEGSVVRARPIAGTRPRGRTSEEDRSLADELIHHEKERAEHIMLVDLERNDIGKISKYGSVKVSELMAIEYYSHVMHIVSEVRGEISDGRDAFDVIAAAFPGGTITGAPKVRTMEIIEELEPVRRGPYTGSIGWIDYNGNMELNIVIRTLVAKDGIGYVQAGAGIVIDSIPHKEYDESLSKAKALWKAIQCSESFLAALPAGSQG
ncbi:anthranilate synthase component I family protein [Paenibacillus aurantius]|uniref:Anthranilate synthase component I family protein n=2 Tax=Paenibacillus aurantius TaxID=2918900 RepID=A0AA96LMZ7_9BACL|nr:anthranilate synthase component I family protein [Paenibacillus aurantius]WNQ14132.1 anthranilate synthase component I family protein [Paenibacillus aurantius]